MKRLIEITEIPEGHWVGDGFPVRTIFSSHSLGQRISPFLLLDHAGPAEFPPSDKPRGVEEHPHRGFETVTIVFSGALEHRDSGGNAGAIGPGDVQWMTAAGGVLHEEMHAREFTRNGGTFEVAQLWVNLPAKDKLSPPRYQTLLAGEIPTVNLLAAAGTARIIAGEFQGTRGLAKTFTPIDLWDLKLSAGKRLTLPFREGRTAALFVRSGAIALEGGAEAVADQLALFDRAAGDITINARQDSAVLVLSGEPIDEPIAAYGPFVMNTADEIRQAMEDYRAGRMGTLS